jgi:hypothetical protein
MIAIAQAIGMDSLAIEIGGVAILLESDSPEFRAMVEKFYPGYVRQSAHVDSGLPVLRFSVEVIGQGQLIGDEDVRVFKDCDQWRIHRNDFRAELNLESGSGCIRQVLNPYGLNSILRIVHTLYLAHAHGFLLHAASAVRNNRAFVFSGVSGAGKTTISRCAPTDAALLTDEISYIRRSGSQYLAWGTPFAGEMGSPGANICAPVAELFFLEKGPENRIDDLDQREAVRLLLRNTLFFHNDETAVRAVFDSACDFLERVPARRLTFVRDASVRDLIH